MTEKSWEQSVEEWQVSFVFERKRMDYTLQFIYNSTRGGARKQI